MWAVMLVRAVDYKKKVYLPSVPGLDDKCKALAEEHCGLRLSEWKVMWYDDENDPQIVSEFLPPDYKPTV
jgi:hypothetical protein